MDIKIAREVAARVWCDPEMSDVEMDVEKAEKIAQILVGGPTPRALDASPQEAQADNNRSSRQ